MGQGDADQTGTSASGSLCTRSHSRAALVWSVQDMLILVNEIAAVEGDCQNALSSYQKWIIIAENCTALEVVRNSTQCRRKWESLLAEYKLVKGWESNARGESYWSLGCERRKEIGLPLDFHEDLYKAIDNLTTAQEGADTDPESDPEDAEEVDLLNAEDSGSKPKRLRRQSTPQGEITERKKVPELEEGHEKTLSIVKGREQILAEKLKENSELIHAILAASIIENQDKELADLKDKKTLETESARCKANKLMACLGDLAKNLKLLCDVVEER